MSFDVTAGLRRLAPMARTGSIQRRPVAALQFLGIGAPPGDILLDTTWYIDAMRGALPADAAMLTDRLGYHSAICVAELTHALGRLDPRDPRTEANADTIERYVAGLPPIRIIAPSVQVIGDAGILAGIVARQSQVSADRRQALLNDAIIYLQALEEQLIVVTRNVADFDLLNQIVPAGRVLFYNRSEGK